MEFYFKAQEIADQGYEIELDFLANDGDSGYAGLLDLVGQLEMFGEEFGAINDLLSDVTSIVNRIEKATTEITTSVYFRLALAFGAFVYRTR